MKKLVSDHNGRKRVERKSMCLWLWGVIFLFFCNVVMGQVIDNWHNSLKPNGKAGSVLILAEEGKSNYSIVISESPTTQDQKAAEELQ